MKLWFLKICELCPLTLRLCLLTRIPGFPGPSVSVLLRLLTSYRIYAQSSSLVTDKHNTCRCASPSLNERTRMCLCPWSVHWFSWHLLKLIIFANSPFLSIHQRITNSRRIRTTEKNHTAYISLGKNLREGSLKSYIRQYSSK